MPAATASDTMNWNFKLLRTSRARRLRRDRRGHVDPDRQGRPPHPVAGARERAEELHRRRCQRSARPEDRRARPTCRKPICARTRWRRSATSWRSPTRRQQPGLQPAGFELFDISVPENPRSISLLRLLRADTRAACTSCGSATASTIHMSSGAADFEPTQPSSTTSSTGSSTCATRRSRRRSAAGGCPARGTATPSRRRCATRRATIPASARTTPTSIRERPDRALSRLSSTAA